MTAPEDPAQIAAKLRTLLAKASPLPWEIDTDHNEDGEYGPGPDPGRGYDDFMILAAKGGKILGTENATHKLIEEDRPDEDGCASAWDQIGKDNGELVIEAVNTLPRLLAFFEMFTDRDDLVDLVRPACLGNDQAGRVANVILAAVHAHLLGESPHG